MQTYVHYALFLRRAAGTNASQIIYVQYFSRGAKNKKKQASPNTYLRTALNSWRWYFNTWPFNTAYISVMTSSSQGFTK